MRLPLCLGGLERVSGAPGNQGLLALLATRVSSLLLRLWALGLRAGPGSRRYRLRQPCRWGFTVKCALTAGTAAITTAARGTTTTTATTVTAKGTAASATATAAADRHRPQRRPPWAAGERAAPRAALPVSRLLHAISATSIIRLLSMTAH